MKTAVKRELEVWVVVAVFVLGYVSGAAQTDCLDWIGLMINSAEFDLAPK